MPGVRVIEGERLTMRTIEEADQEFWRRNQNDPDVRHLSRNVHPKNAKQVEDAFEKYVVNLDGGGLGLLACLDDDPIGNFFIHPANEADRTFWVGAWLDADYHGQGYAPEATALVLDYGFEQMNARKYITGVYEPNYPSQRVMEKLGFTREAVKREAVFIDGEHVDVYNYGLFRDEWDGWEAVVAREVED